MTMLHADSRENVAVFDAIKAVHRTRVERDIVMPVAEELARYAAAGLEVHDTGASEHRAYVVVMNATEARASARRLLDAGTAVVIVPPQSRATTLITRSQGRPWVRDCIAEHFDRTQGRRRSLRVVEAPRHGHEDHDVLRWSLRPAWRSRCWRYWGRPRCDAHDARSRFASRSPR